VRWAPIAYPPEGVAGRVGGAEVLGLEMRATRAATQEGWPEQQTEGWRIMCGPMGTQVPDARFSVPAMPGRPSSERPDGSTRSSSSDPDKPNFDAIQFDHSLFANFADVQILADSARPVS
jgi:hypothetical protein